MTPATIKRCLRTGLLLAAGAINSTEVTAKQHDTVVSMNGMAVWSALFNVARPQRLRMTGEIVNGIHVADSALINCIIKDYHLRHMHFVDLADGGYALGAVMLKVQ